MTKMKVTIHMNAQANTVTVMDRGKATTFDRSTMVPWQRNRLRRMIVEAWRKTQ